MNDFLKVHKEYSYNKNIPNGSYLCEICENCILLAKGLNKKLKDPLPTNPHDLVEKFACNLEVRDCVFNHCESCCSSVLDFGPKKIDSNASSKTSDEQIEDDEVTYFSWTKIDERITKATFTVLFDDTVTMMKNQIKVLKEHISVKRTQNTAYNEHKDSLRDKDLFIHVDFAEIQSAYFGHQSFSLFTSCCYYKGTENTLQQKNIVVVMENSDHNRVTSMSSLKRVIETVDNEVGKRFSRLIVWSDGMSAQFRSRFVFKLSVGTLFPGKSMSWFYNERQHGKGPMDGVGGTLEDVIFREVKSG